MKNIKPTNRVANLGRPIIVASLVAFSSSALGQRTEAGANLLLFSADGTMNIGEWQIVNDGVMGGKSESSVSTKPNGSLLFTGNVSLKNNGGFASTRSPSITGDLSAYEGIELIVTGDGNAYKCGIRTENGFNGIAHQATFETVSGTEQRIRIPFADFEPTWRGRRLADDKRMNPEDIKNIGFLISDKQEGPFQLEVKSISAYRDDGREAPVNGSDIITIAQEVGIFKTLLAAVEAAGLTDTVRSLEGVTLFAPTDEAFAKLPEGTIASLLEPRNKDTLINILSYHVIAAEVPFSTATTLTRATALNNEELTIRVKQGGLFINDSRVIENDIVTDNGLIHVIDAVLLPPETNPAELPPVETIILSAIRRGVSQFNSGNHQACADLYELAAEALIVLPEDQLSKQQRNLLTKALRRSQKASSATDRAWIMRNALDTTLAHSHE